MNLPSTSAEVVLYDSALGGTPDVQGKLLFQTSPNALAVQTFDAGATTLDTGLGRHDAAGYMIAPSHRPRLDRSRGYTIELTVQIVEESHGDSDKNGDDIGDRAGFSVIALSDDLKGIELGFWKDEIWAQEDGAAEPPGGALFTHAEGAAFDTTADLTRYTLTVQDDVYRLSTGGQAVLSGRLRDYTAFDGPVNPYSTPNFVFLGDDTGSAQAVIRLSYVAVRENAGM
jgi:hypothetical protein